MRTDLLVLFTRPFWLDEWHTILVARRESLSQVIADLHSGSDFGPPLSHIVAWLWRHVFGLGEVSLRVLALGAVLTGLAFVFLALRRRFATLPSVAGVLAIASHQLVLSQSLEWRFYAPWMLFACALAWSFSIDETKPVSRRRDVSIALFSIGLVTSHWFGVITLGLMGMAAFLALGHPERSEGSAGWFSNWRYAIRRVLPVAAGIVVLAICLPLMFGQRASIVEKSWMPDFAIGQLFAMGRMFWLAFIPLAAIVIALAVALRPAAREQQRTGLRAAIADPSMLALLAPLVMPLLLAVISLRQPAMLPRYAITSLIAWAPLVAFALQPLNRGLRVTVVLVLAVLTYSRLLRVGIEHRNFVYAVAAGKQALQQACEHRVPVVFQVRHLMYPSTDALPTSDCDVRYLSISDATLASMYPGANSQTPRFFRIENEFSVLHGKLYGYPAVITEAQLDTTRAFLLVAWDASLPSRYKDIERFRAVVFPQHQVTRLTENLAGFQIP